MLNDHALSRRSLLAGLAAASTLAAGAMPGAAAQIPENPELLRLGDQIAEAERQYREASALQQVVLREGSRRFPETPEELFLKREGEYVREPGWGDCERAFHGGARYRTGEDKPRRVVHLSGATYERDAAAKALAHKRMAKHGKLYGRDRAAWEREYREAKPLGDLAEGYYAECARVREDLNHDAVWRDTSAKSLRLADLISAIMAEKENTMEGVMIKARALEAWGCVGDLFAPGMTDWGPQFAASVMRQASSGIEA